MRGFIVVAGVGLLAGAADAAAQSAYVGASMIGDIVRVSGTTSVVSGDTPGGGEALGFALRVGTPLGARWGVEAEFARPAEIEDEGPSGVIPLAQLAASLAPGVSLPSIFPPISFQTRFRNTTISTGAWVQHDLSVTASLAYLAGLGFYRSERGVELSFDPRVLASELAAIGLILPYGARTVLYGVKPFVGIEARIGLGEHARFVPGLRLHAVDNGWLVRPGVGVNWTF